MNQPKFKIGDVVYYPGRLDRVGVKFQVDEIRIHGKEGVHYSGYQNKHIHESHLALFVEPQKKKLFAYECLNPGERDGQEIRFFKTEMDTFGSILQRNKEYDIEYPEAKV